MFEDVWTPAPAEIALGIPPAAREFGNLSDENAGNSSVECSPMFTDVIDVGRPRFSSIFGHVGTPPA
jgi:hypothetical protein